MKDLLTEIEEEVGALGDARVIKGGKKALHLLKMKMLGGSGKCFVLSKSDSVKVVASVEVIEKEEIGGPDGDPTDENKDDLAETNPETTTQG